MILKKIFFTYIFLSCIMGTELYAKPQNEPLWLCDVNGIYNETNYIARVGDGTSQVFAKMEALNSISEYFKTKVQFKGEMSRIAATGADSSYSTSAVQKISVQSNTELFCVEYEFYYDKKKKKHYCLAFINKEKFWKQFQPRIENKKYEFEKSFNEAEKLLPNEPILAKKYYILSEYSGNELADLILTARLVVEETANIYEKEEKHIFEIEKKIKDAENKIAIFIDIQGDWSNAVVSSIKTLFENEGYSFTNGKNNCSHIMKIIVEQNLLVSGKGTEYETVSVAPSLSLVLLNPYTQQTVFSFSRKTVKTGGLFNKDVALRKGYENLCVELENSLIQKYRQKMSEK